VTVEKALIARMSRIRTSSQLSQRSEMRKLMYFEDTYHSPNSFCLHAHEKDIEMETFIKNLKH